MELEDGWRVLWIKWPKTYPILYSGSVFYEYLLRAGLRKHGARARWPTGARLGNTLILERLRPDNRGNRLRFSEPPDNITHQESLNCGLWDKKRLEE